MQADPARNVQKGKFEVGLGLMRKEVSYDIECDSRVEYEFSFYSADRRIISLYGAYGISDELDVFLALAYIPEVISKSRRGVSSFASDRTNEDNYGSGIQIGLRYGSYFGKSPFSIRLYGLLNNFSEIHGPATIKIYPSELPEGVPPGAYLHGIMYRKLSITEGILGGLIAYDLRAVRYYIGIETFPIQMGNYENYRDSEYQIVYSDEGGTVKRLGTIGRLGFQLTNAKGNLWLRGEMRLCSWSKAGYTMGICYTF